MSQPSLGDDDVTIDPAKPYSWLPRSRRAGLWPGETIESLLEREELFTVDARGVARLPSLVGGALLLPEIPAPDLIEEAIASGRPCVDIGETQLIMVDGQVGNQSLTCLALPRLADPAAAIPGDIVDQIAALHPLPFAEVLQHIDRIGAAMGPGGPIVARALPLAIACSDVSESFVRLGFDHVHFAYDAAAVATTVDRELAYAGRRGRAYLEGWVEIEDEIAPGAMAMARARIGDEEAKCPPKRRVRAMPMSQLHVTAGNSPVVPAISALRALATKGPVTVKLPSGALVAGAAFALALWAAGPDHPLVRFSTVAYWRGGDEAVESALFRHGAFERIVVWGSRDSVEAVASQAAGTKTLVFNPRYGVSLIGSEALVPERLGETVRRAAQDTMIWNQQACIASLVHYVEGGEDAVEAYCAALRDELALWDAEHGAAPDRAMVGRIRTARRGELADGRWMPNGPPVAPSSAVVRMDRSFDLSSHPMARIVVVRPVEDLAGTLELMHAGVSSVGVFPPERLDGLRDGICGRGVSSAIPLGEADTIFNGAPHDGMRPLAELVSWAVS
jgi:hypothetical protein